ncbi:Hypothetical_protein [Hexamita inflata]|uniref:Hypothetical_protein n=1 Tax=Hexamita inflata TaxID=28002 RepID=A0AA86NUQ4_9EUKA|nr:Hypothetical protein HINF_LOCUS13010 [Hexamita inflata]
MDPKEKKPTSILIFAGTTGYTILDLHMVHEMAYVLRDNQLVMDFKIQNNTVFVQLRIVDMVVVKASSLPGFLAGRAEISWQEEDSRRFGILNLANCQKAMNKFIKPNCQINMYIQKQK